MNDTKIHTAGNPDCLFVTGTGSKIIISMFGDCESVRKYVNLEMALTEENVKALISSLQKRLEADAQ